MGHRYPKFTLQEFAGNRSEHRQSIENIIDGLMELGVYDPDRKFKTGSLEKAIPTINMLIRSKDTEYLEKVFEICQVALQREARPIFDTTYFARRRIDEFFQGHLEVSIGTWTGISGRLQQGRSRHYDVGNAVP